MENDNFISCVAILVPQNQLFVRHSTPAKSQRLSMRSILVPLPKVNFSLLKRIRWSAARSYRQLSENTYLLGRGLVLMTATPFLSVAKSKAHKLTSENNPHGLI